MSNAVIYVRVSTKEQTKNYSLASQEQACRDYCERSGFAIVKVFREEGESAKTADRTELGKMLDYCTTKKNHINYVVVYHVDRFARNTLDHQHLRALLRKHDVLLRTVTTSIDENPEGLMLENLMSVFAQYDNDKRARNTRTGMQAAIRAGRWPFQTPVGYIKKGERRSSQIEIDPVAGPLLRTAFEMYATGLHTMKDVLDHVTSLGLRSRKNKKINRQSFDRHLRNPFYAGWVSSPEWKVRERGAFEALVSDDVFSRVQALLDGRAVAITPHVRNHPDFPLRGFVRCGTCGRPLTASWSKGRSKKYPYYFCPPAAKCNKSKMAKSELEQQFIALLERLRPRPEYLRLFHAVVLDVWKERSATAAAIGEAKQRRVRELHDKTSRLVDAFLEKLVSKATFEAEQDRLEKDIAIAELEANEAKIDQLDIDAALRFAEYVLTNAARLWREADLDQKQRLQRVLFPEGSILKDGKVSTAVTCSIYSWLQPVEGENASLASLTGFEPVSPP